jgi:hypothetical protein
MGRRRAITSHSFRSTFSDWASEVSPFSSELRETALAHTIGNKAEALTAVAMHWKSGER